MTKPPVPSGGSAKTHDERCYRQRLELFPDAILIHAKGRLLFANGAALRLLGASDADPLIGKPVTDFIHPDYRELIPRRPRMPIQGGTSRSFKEGKLLRIDGSGVDVEVASIPLGYDGQSAVQTVARDISEHKRAEGRLYALARHDVLTGLANLGHFRHLLSEALARAKRLQTQLALLFIDLYRFKRVNDALGHSSGDVVLKELARRLKNCAREGDTVARLGGDEFCLILEPAGNRQFIANTANDVLHALSQAVDVAQHEIIVGASVGIGLFPEDALEPDDLLRAADLAMHHAKRQGSGHFQFYNSAMNTRRYDRLGLGTRLRRALKRQELELYYQPQVDVTSSRIVAVEALVRWLDPEFGPERFIPLAEESGEIVAIGEWALKTACAQAKSWQNKGLDPIRVAVNLSVQQLEQTDLAQNIAAILQETGLEPACLELEITESAIAVFSGESVSMLKRLRTSGVQLTIDDFGTGYSNLSYLKRFPLNRLKIDKTFVRHVTRDPDDAAIVRAIIAVAKALRLKTTAEGVETADQLEWLRRHRCNDYQGYYFAVPLKHGDIAKLLPPATRG
ncbi:MAG: putative bifunctional diguanylate cyclase/phosphodiesterase [Burkholderiales bacterium]